MSKDYMTLLAVLVGAISWMLARWRWRRLGYSVPAFFAVPLGIVAAYRGDWVAAGNAAAIAVVFVAVAFFKRPRKKEQDQ